MSNLRIHTLDNGLTVLLQESHTVPIATFWVWYRVGSRNETPGLTGISHWVEHMLFKGTPTHPKGTLTRYIDRLGGRWNAFTWKDYTAYHEVLPAEHLDVAIRLEADRMANTIMDPSEVDSERTVIISEREGSENHPSYLLREEVDAVAHKVHPYRIPVIGWKDDLRAITRDELFHHYRTFYHPQNAIAVAIGAFDAEEALQAITRAFGEVPPGPAVPSVRVHEPEQEGERRVMLRRPGGATSYLHIAYHAPAASHPDLAALLVTDGVLSGFKGILPFDQAGGGRSSRLYRALVDTGLATDVSSSVTPSTDPTLFQVAATVRAGGEAEMVEERVLTEVERLAREPVSADELAKVKKQAKAQVVFSRDGVFRLALGLGAFAVVDEPAAFESLVSRIDQITANDVMRVAQTYLTEGNRTVGWYQPTLGATASAAQAAVRPEVFFFQSPPAEDGVSPARAAVQVAPITPETVTRSDLHNGLVVLVKEMRGTGLVIVQGYVKAGAMFDGSRSGLAR
jgi:zinc protease